MKVRFRVRGQGISLPLCKTSRGQMKVFQSPEDDSIYNSYISIYARIHNIKKHIMSQNLRSKTNIMNSRIYLQIHTNC